MKAKITFRNIKAYIQGNIRYGMYYSWFNFLIPKHIKEQIDWRIEIMDKECFDNGSCKLCGCETTALQMANKACDKPCYPRMYSRSVWKALKPIYKKLYKENRELFNHVIENE
jgi:hypothetical protein